MLRKLVKFVDLPLPNRRRRRAACMSVLERSSSFNHDVLADKRPWRRLLEKY